MTVTQATYNQLLATLKRTEEARDAAVRRVDRLTQALGSIAATETGMRVFGDVIRPALLDDDWDTERQEPPK
jgi:hypothetical protein